MIAYGISQAGRSHIERGLPCQDSHRILPAQEDGVWIAGVADGVGSAAHAEVGAQIAVREAVSFCARCLPPDRSLAGTYSMVRTAMNYALKQVLREAQDSGEPPASYDTTLTLAIYDGTRVIYGHAGDGGLFALRCDGAIVEVTTPQHGADGQTVIPLSGGFQGWEIGTYPHDVASLLLVTDGVRAALRPTLLALGAREGATEADAKADAGASAETGAKAGTPAGANAKANAPAGAAADAGASDPGIYQPLVRFFADPRGLAGEHPAAGASDVDDALLAAISDMLAGQEGAAVDAYHHRIATLLARDAHPDAAGQLERLHAAGMGERLLRAVRDDRSVVVLANPDAALRAPATPYREPSWDALADVWERTLFPALTQAEPAPAQPAPDERPLPPRWPPRRPRPAR